MTLGSLLVQWPLALLLCLGASRGLGLHTHVPTACHPLSGWCKWLKALLVLLSVAFFFPVGKALPGFCHSSVSFLSSQNISKLLYAVTQQLDSALVLSWFSQVETLLTNVGVCKSLTPADCVGVIKCMENMINPTWSSLSLSQFASRLSWNTAPFCPLCFLISFLCCCLAVKYYVLQ